MNIIDVIKSGDFLVLDCETTGLGSDAEICQIAIVNAKGETLLDTLVKPVNGIPAEATRIHGITNEMVAEAKPFLFELVEGIIRGKNIIIYNAEYDVKLLAQSECAVTHMYRLAWHHMSTFHCAMKHFAPIAGDWNEYRKSYRWKSLAMACNFYGIENQDAHSALSDCLATLAVCKKMAEIEQV